MNILVDLVFVWLVVGVVVFFLELEEERPAALWKRIAMMPLMVIISMVDVVKNK